MGIDAGGTNTRAVALTSQFQQRHRVILGPASLSKMGMLEAVEVLVAGIRRVARGVAIGGVVVGITGCRTAADAENLSRTLGMAIQAPVRCVSDAYLAWAGATRWNCAMGVLIAGTGSAAYGRRPDGTECLVGGWGHLLGDLGSGYWLGLMALRRSVERWERREPSELLNGILAQLGVSTAEALVDRVYRGNPIRVISGIAPLVLDAAARMDPDALAVTRRNVQALTQLTATLVERLAWDGTERHGVVPVGGCFAHTAYRAMYLRAVRHRLPWLDVGLPELAPEMAAAHQAVSWAIRSRRDPECS